MSCGERLTWGAVANFDVAKSPANLGHRICTPIGGDNFHLISRKGLGNSCRATATVSSLEIPVALTFPEAVEASGALDSSFWRLH